MYDLIVIGSGIIGTFHAYHAAKAGKKVLVLEKDQRPVNATVRNFGQVIPSGMAHEWFRYGRRGAEIYREIQSKYDVSARNNGTVYIASDADEQQLLHEVKSHHASEGYDSVLLSKDEILKKYPVVRPSYAKEALFFPQEFSVEPNLFIHRIHEFLLTEFKNIEIKKQSTVIDCSVSGNDVIVTVAGGKKFRSEFAVVASGHEFKILFPEIFSAAPLSVCKLHMLRRAADTSLPLEGNIATGLSIRRYEAFTECASYKNIKTPDHLAELKKWGIHILFKKAIDGSLIIGDSHEYAKVGEEDQLGYENNQYINKLMLDEAKRIVDIDLGELKETWAGFYGLHNDKEIFEHAIEDKIFFRLGIGGKGMTCSAGYAEESIANIFSGKASAKSFGNEPAKIS